METSLGDKESRIKSYSFSLRKQLISIDEHSIFGDNKAMSTI